MNNIDRDQILASFEPDIAQKLLEFADALSKHDTDVFVFMSRKFCCLYDVLMSIGVAPVEKPIVSDKVLDFDTDFFVGKRVTLVDDIIICGTTIWKAKSKLEQMHRAAKVETFVFCINEKYWVPELVQPEYRTIVLSDRRSLTFCSSIVSALSITPRPYAVEFPYFETIDVKQRYWHQILSSKDWNVYDISNKVQELAGVSVLTFFPSATVTENFEGHLGTNLAKLVDIAKIRVYAKKSTWRVETLVVPIVTFKPLTSSALKAIFDSLLDKIGSFGITESVLSRFVLEHTNPLAQLRFVQYLASLMLASSFQSNLQTTLEKPLKLQLRNLDVELLFGRWNLEIVTETAERLLTAVSTTAFTDIEKFAPAIVDLENTELALLMQGSKDELAAQLHTSGDGISDNDPRNIFSDFSNVFLSLYQKKEIPSRQAVTLAAKKEDWLTIIKADRLETGITWSGILEYLKSIFHYSLTQDVRNVLSLVLDYSVDKGICVPITRLNTETDVIFRAYRHGEDVLFAEEETELCGLAIESAENAIGKGELTKLFVEKLLVLFIRIGASKGILQVQYGTSGQDGIAKIGFYLHGAVAKLKKRNTYNAESDLWLSRHLLEKGVIKKTARDRYAFSKHFPAIQVTSTARTEAEKFGHILGLLFRGQDLSDDTSVRLNDDDLVFLSTCFRPRDVAAALLVELDIYTESLAPIVATFQEQFRKRTFSKGRSKKSLITNKGYTALNSLHKKTIGWFGNGARTAIEKGSKILEKSGQFTGRLDWESYWDSLQISEVHDESNRFQSVIARMSLIGHRLLLNLHLLEVMFCFDSKNRSYSDNEELRESIDRLNRFFARGYTAKKANFSKSDYQLMENLNKQIRKDLEGFDEDKIMHYVFRTSNQLNEEFSKVSPQVTKLLDEFDQYGEPTKRYDYVVYYDIVDSTATKALLTKKEVESYRTSVRKTKSLINGFILDMEKVAANRGDEVYCWNGDASSTNDAKHIFFSSSKEGFSIRRAGEFLERLFGLSNSEINFRVLAAPTNLFFSPVFRRFSKTEVEGEQFWEHYSRVHKRFKELEAEHPGGNLVLVAGNIKTPPASRRLPLAKKLWADTIETQIAGAFFKVQGELWRPR